MRVRFGLVAIALMAAVAGCGKPSSQPAPLATVQPLPSPSVPAWITQIAPLGNAKPTSQIRVIFASPLLPVEQLGSPIERSVLTHFRVDPAIAGTFIALTPRMIGFQSGYALPPATRVRVTVTAGLRDLGGHVLDRDLAWTFTTTPLQIALPEDAPTPAVVGLRPQITVRANAQIDPGELSRYARFRRLSDNSSVPAAVSGSPAPSDEVSSTFDYELMPAADLQTASSYVLEIEPGVTPVRGNIAGVQTIIESFDTYAPLKFTGAMPTPDPLTQSSRFAAGDPAFIFNNALDEKTYAAHVHVQPAPRGVGQLLSLSDDGNAVLLNPYALDPQTAYSVHFDAGLQDAFGQRLGHDVEASYRTGHLAAYFWAPAGTNTFAAPQNLQLQYEAVNLPSNRYKAAYRVLSPGDVANFAGGDARDLLPDPKTWSAYPVRAAPDRSSYVRVPLREQLGGPFGMLAYGAQSSVQGGDQFSGTVQLTDLGVFAQWFPSSGFVSVQRLDDGEPVAGASVDVYVPRSTVDAPAARLCAHGVTNAEGSVTIDGPSLQSCYAQNQPSSDAPSLMAVARSGPDWAYTTTYPWSGLYEYSDQYFDGTWSNGQPISRGIVYSDRQMYQPGERGWFTAACYVLQNGVLTADANATYGIILRDPDGNERKLPSQRTNRYATFSFPLDFAKTQPLGYYTIVATGSQGAQITGSFRLAQFRPPNFSVDLKLDRKYAAPGDAVQASGTGRYLFGAPMSGANASLHVTRQPAALSPSGWDDFTFGRQWFWPEEQPEASSDVSAQSLALDSSGAGSEQIRVGNDLPYAMTYTVDFEVSDVSNLSSSATQSFTALPGMTLIGLKNDYVGAVNGPVPVSAITVDPQGKPQPGTQIHVELQKMEYSSATQIVEGAETPRNQVRYATVDSADVTSGSSAVALTLKAAGPGPYRIRANFPGTQSDATATDSQIWITGPGEAAWSQQNPTQLQMKLDRSVYRAGDAAEVAVASPYDRADLYLSVVRDRILYKTLVRIRGASPKIRIPVSAAMFPNAALEGVLVRRGAPFAGAGVKTVDSLVRIGLVPIAMTLDPQYLKIEAKPLHASIEPAQKQTLRFSVLDSRGKPVQAQLTIAVVNDAILQLSGYRFPDLVKTVFDTQPISTRFADNRPGLTLTQPSDVSEKGWGYGGGFLAGAAGTRVRTKFLPLAYFNGAVQTAADGTASVTFAVPDNLTTWRALIVASTAGSRPEFANADTTFVTTKPLVTDPLLPQFARPGDRFSGGLLLANSTPAAVDARTEALLNGNLTFQSSGGNGQTTTARQQFAPGMNAWRFPIVAGAPGIAGLTMRTSISNGASDAFRVPLEIRDTNVTESTIDAGSTKTSEQIPVAAGDSTGKITIEVSGSLLSQVIGPAQKALSSDDLPLLPVAWSRLSIAASLQRLESSLGVKIGSVDPRGAASASIAQLRRLARADGGFSLWPDAHWSDPFETAAALEALAQAQRSGLDGPQDLIARAKEYTVHALADPHGSAKWCDSAECKASLRLRALIALAAGGDRRTDFLQSIYAERDGLGLAERVLLAVYLQQTPGWEQQANTLAAELQNEVYETGRYSNVQTSSAWLGSGVEAQAAYLQLLVARAAPQNESDRALAALVAQSCKCGWPGEDDTAAALLAIADYSDADRTVPNFDLTVEVDGENVGRAHFSGKTQQPQSFVVQNLRAGRHEIVLSKSGTGTLRYTVAYTYRLSARAPGRLAGLRVSRTVRPANGKDVLASMDIAPLRDPLSVAPGNVFDVELSVTTDHPVDRVTIEDPLPAGFEALDTSFQTVASYYQPLADSWQIDYQQIYADRIAAFAQHLDPGVYTLHYLVRSVTPGTYLWPGANAHLLNAPEQFGRSAFSELTISSS